MIFKEKYRRLDSFNNFYERNNITWLDVITSCQYFYSSWKQHVYFNNIALKRKLPKSQVIFSVKGEAPPRLVQYRCLRVKIF